MKSLLRHLTPYLALCMFIGSACNREPFKPDYENIGGLVIGKETCNTDESQDYWIADFTVYPNTPQVGDSLTLNGVTYTNVLKIKDLDPRLKQVGMRVSIDYKTITTNIVVTTGCTVANPRTYALKEIFIINQFEIR